VKKQYVWIVAVILCLGTTALFAQDGKDRFDWRMKGNFNPFIEANYGLSKPKQKKFENTFANTGLIDAKLGYSKAEKYRGMVWELDERYVFGDYLSSDAEFLRELNGNVKTNISRFGVGNRLGYGYDLGIFTLLPYNQNQFIWTKINSTRPDSLSQNDTAILDRYEGVYRFGISTEGGAKILLFNTFSINASYELSVVYPRHIFWPWLGSYIILQTGLNAVSVFSEDIIRSSKLLGPVMYFVLKNGLAYVFYTQLQDKMNWPFDSETPLTIEALKIGASITF
jgi:hypothetical protein